MKVLVAGATGALGRRLLPALKAAGHVVTALVRDARGRDAVSAGGAGAVLADALDPPAVLRAVQEAAPDAIVNQLTPL